MIVLEPEMLERRRCRGAINKQLPMALDLGDETVKGELVYIKVKNDLGVGARVFVLNLYWQFRKAL
jgi:hypothetical protein